MATLRTWDVVAKYLFGGILTAFITMFGYYLQHENDNRTAWNQKQAAQEAKAQSIIALTSKQKDMDVQIAVDMFKALTDSYFKAGTKPDDDELHRRLLLLRLVALNFQDVPIQLRPLFEDLDRQLKRPEDHIALRNIALELASRQAFRLTIGGLYNQIFTVKSGESVPIKELQVTVLIDSVRKESIHAEIVSELALSGKVAYRAV